MALQPCRSTPSCGVTEFRRTNRFGFQLPFERPGCSLLPSVQPTSGVLGTVDLVSVFTFTFRPMCSAFALSHAPDSRVYLLHWSGFTCLNTWLTAGSRWCRHLVALFIDGMRNYYDISPRRRAQHAAGYGVATRTTSHIHTHARARAQPRTHTHARTRILART